MVKGSKHVCVNNCVAQRETRGGHSTAKHSSRAPQRGGGHCRGGKAGCAGVSEWDVDSQREDSGRRRGRGGRVDAVSHRGRRTAERLAEARRRLRRGKRRPRRLCRALAGGQRLGTVARRFPSRECPAAAAGPPARPPRAEGNERELYVLARFIRFSRREAWPGLCSPLSRGVPRVRGRMGVLLTGRLFVSIHIFSAKDICNVNSGT